MILSRPQRTAHKVGVNASPAPAVLPTAVERPAKRTRGDVEVSPPIDFDAASSSRQPVATVMVGSKPSVSAVTRPRPAIERTPPPADPASESPTQAEIRPVIPAKPSVRLEQGSGADASGSSSVQDQLSLIQVSHAAWALVDQPGPSDCDSAIASRVIWRHVFAA